MSPSIFCKITIRLGFISSRIGFSPFKIARTFCSRPKQIAPPSHDLTTDGFGAFSTSSVPHAQLSIKKTCPSSDQRARVSETSLCSLLSFLGLSLRFVCISTLIFSLLLPKLAHPTSLSTVFKNAASSSFKGIYAYIWVHAGRAIRAIPQKELPDKPTAAEGTQETAPLRPQCLNHCLLPFSKAFRTTPGAPRRLPFCTWQ